MLESIKLIYGGASVIIEHFQGNMHKIESNREPEDTQALRYAVL